MPYLLTLAWKNYQKLSAVASKNGIGYCHRHLFLAMRNLPKKIIILLQTLFLQTFYILTTNLLQKLDGLPHTVRSMLVVGASKSLILLIIFTSIMFLVQAGKKALAFETKFCSSVKKCFDWLTYLFWNLKLSIKHNLLIICQRNKLHSVSRSMHNVFNVSWFENNNIFCFF